MINKLQEVIPPIGYTSKTEIRCHLNNANTYYGMANGSNDAKTVEKQTCSSSIIDEYRYINNTHRNVTIGKRDGLFLTINATPDIKTNVFIIRRTLVLKNESLVSAIACISSISNIQTEDMQKIKDALSNINIKVHKDISIMLDYHVDVSLLNVKNNTIYHYQSDTQISLLSCTEVPPHPYSYDFLNVGAFGNSNDYTNQTEFNFKIKYFNHSPNTGPKFVNMLGKVFVLHPQKDAPVRNLTVYTNNKKTIVTHCDYIELIYSNKNIPGTNIKDGIACEYYSLEEAKNKIGLYDTYLEALSCGDIDSVRKKELSEITHEIEQTKLENVKYKINAEKQLDERKIILNNQAIDIEKNKMDLAEKRANLDQEKAKQDQAQANLDATLLHLENKKRILDMEKKENDSILDRERTEQNAKLKQEQMYWQDYYEKRSYARKDTSDAIKFVPGLLIGLCGIAATWFKLTHKSA